LCTRSCSPYTTSNFSGTASCRNVRSKEPRAGVKSIQVFHFHGTCPSSQDSLSDYFLVLRQPRQPFAKQRINRRGFLKNTPRPPASSLYCISPRRRTWTIASETPSRSHRIISWGRMYYWTVPISMGSRGLVGGRAATDSGVVSQVLVVALQGHWGCLGFASVSAVGDELE
jgi:hypothetical protein